MGKELDSDSRNHIESEICEPLGIPTEITDANATSQSSTSLTRRDLLQEYGRKFAELLDVQKLSKPCSDAGFLEEIGKGQFNRIIEEGSEVMQTACREYAQHRNLKTSRPRGWIRSNTKTGPVLDVKIYPQEGRYCIDIMIESLFKGQTVSCLRSVNFSCQTILKRWYRDDKYRKSLSEEGLTEEHIRQYDALALEDQTYEATLGERRRWEKNWHIF